MIYLNKYWLRLQAMKVFFLNLERGNCFCVHMLGKLGLNVLNWIVFRYWRKYIEQNPSSSDEPLMTVMIKTLINIEYSWMRKTTKWLLSARWCMHNWYAEILMRSMAKSQYLSKKKNNNKSKISSSENRKPHWQHFNNFPFWKQLLFGLC